VRSLWNVFYNLNGCTLFALCRNAIELVCIYVPHHSGHVLCKHFFLFSPSLNRRYKEARQLAQKHEYHEKQKEQEYKTSSANASSKVFKRTQVMIMPFCEYFDEFESFESVMQAIHQARKNAFDLITDLSIEKLERRNKSINTEQEWRYVSFVCPFLHLFIPP